MQVGVVDRAGDTEHQPERQPGDYGAKPDSRGYHFPTLLGELLWRADEHVHELLFVALPGLGIQGTPGQKLLAQVIDEGAVEIVPDLCAPPAFPVQPQFDLPESAIQVRGAEDQLHPLPHTEVKGSQPDPQGHGQAAVHVVVHVQGVRLWWRLGRGLMLLQIAAGKRIRGEQAMGHVPVGLVIVREESRCAGPAPIS